MSELVLWSPCGIPYKVGDHRGTSWVLRDNDPLSRIATDLLIGWELGFADGCGVGARYILFTEERPR